MILICISLIIAEVEHFEHVNCSLGFFFIGGELPVEVFYLLWGCLFSFLSVAVVYTFWI